MSAIRVRG